MNRSSLVAYNTLLILALHLSPFFMLRNYAIALLGAIVVFDRDIVNKTIQLVKKTSFWILLIPFFVYSLSIFYTSDIDSGLKEIEKKASLFLFPLFLGLAKVNKKDFYVFLKGAVLLISFFPVLGFINQWGVYLKTGDSGWFYNDNLVSIFDKQAVYYALFVNTALLILIYLKKKMQLRTVYSKILGIITLVLLLTAQYLLASRTSMLTSLLIIFGYVVWLTLRKLNKKLGLLLVGSVILLAVILLFSFPKVLNRYKSLSNIEYQYNNPNPMNHFNGEIKKENWNGLNTRLAIWNCAWEEIQKSLIIGYGIGDAQQQLVKNYQEKNFILGLRMNYNSHNQYLDVLLTSGIVGLCFFAFFLISLFLKAFQEKNLLLVSFLGIFILSILTENVLNRDQGVVFIYLIISLLSLLNLPITVYDKSKKLGT